MMMIMIMMMIILLKLTEYHLVKRNQRSPSSISLLIRELVGLTLQPLKLKYLMIQKVMISTYTTNTDTNTNTNTTENKETEIHISKLLSIAAIYRKCDTEIKKAVVDYRMNTTHDLLRPYKEESMNSSSSSSKLWKKQAGANANVIVYNFITTSSIDESSTDHVDKDDGWYTSIWDAIVSLNENTLFDYDECKPSSSSSLLSSLSSSLYMGKIRSELIDQLKSLCKNRDDAICKIIHACIGHIYFRSYINSTTTTTTTTTTTNTNTTSYRNDSYETAVEEFALSDMFIDQPTVTFCLFRKLNDLSKGTFGRKLFEENKFDANYFLKWAYSLNPIIGTIHSTLLHLILILILILGLQACRLLIALLHYDVEKSITNKMQLTSYSTKSRSRLSMKLDSAQIVSKENFGIVRKRSTISVVETQVILLLLLLLLLLDSLLLLITLLLIQLY